MGVYLHSLNYICISSLNRMMMIRFQQLLMNHQQGGASVTLIIESQSKEKLISTENDSLVVVNNPLKPKPGSALMTPKQQAVDKENTDWCMSIDACQLLILRILEELEVKLGPVLNWLSKESCRSWWLNYYHQAYFLSNYNQYIFILL